MYPYIRNAADELNEECSIFACRRGSELLALCEKEIIDAVFLDIAMPGFNGFETAKHLSEIRKNMIIVFVSSLEGCVYSSYEYSPFWFVRKSDMKLLKKVSQKVIEKVVSERKETVALPVKAGKRIVEVDFGKTAYFKTDDHYVKIMYKNKEFSQSYRDKLDNIEAQLKEYRFVRCHNRFLVNVRMISYIENSSCTLINGEQLPVSRSKLTETKEAFQNYLRSIR